MKKIPETIYLDYAATTPLEPRVLEVMLPFFNVAFGNPSSAHYYGREAEAAIDSARGTVANALNCNIDEIVFTSCGTESDNLALRGVVFATRMKRNANHVLISPVEHHAVSHTAIQLAELHGIDIEFLPVDQYGRVDPTDVQKRLRSDTAIVSIIYGNNEIGTINPIKEIGEICREKQIPFHTDAVQAGSFLSLDVRKLNVDLLSIGAHKFYGPKGIGGLYISKGTSIMPEITGGNQEFGLRAGTHNVPYIVGLAEALSLAQKGCEIHLKKIINMRNGLIEAVLENIPDCQLTGHPTERLPNHASFVFEGVDGNKLLMMLDVEGFACSSGSACKTGDPKPSSVLLAMGFPSQVALGSLRVTLGINTTEEHISRFANVLPKLVQQNRQLSSAKD